MASWMRSDLNGTLQPSRFITCGVMITPFLKTGYPQRWRSIHRAYFPPGQRLPAFPARVIHNSGQRKRRLVVGIVDDKYKMLGWRAF
jgi:hypothetical protein